MRKLLFNAKAIFATIAMVAVIAVSAVSCQYDDTDIWEKIEEIENDIASLQEKLDTELSAIKALIEGQVTVTEVKQQPDGSKIVTLSDGTKITIYPKGGGLANLITIIEQDGVKYWAMYSSIGNADPIMVNGKMIPVADVVPQTQVVDGVIEVSFDGGATWIKTGYAESVADSIIKDIEIVYSEWQTDAEGNPLPLYSVITFADGSIAKVGMQNGKLVLPYDMIFVPYGANVPFTLEVSDVADYIYTMPRGWECDVEHNAKQSSMTLTFYAPTYADVESGKALGEGVAKVMVVFNNGSSAIASIKLSTNPAKVDFTYEGVYVEAGYGTNYLLCGLIGANSFNPDTIIANCNKVLAENVTVSGITQLSLMESNEVYLPYSELRSSALKAGDEYVFWYVAPRSDENDGLYVEASELVKEMYKHSSAALTVTSTSFFDVNVQFKVVGSEGYMLGLVEADEFSASELATYYTENYDYLNASRADVNFSGSILELMESEHQPLEYGTEYVLWYIAKSKSHKVLEDNVLYWSFSTKDFVEGGSLEVNVVGEPVVSYKSIDVDINSTGNHIMLAYNVLPSYMASAYPDDARIINMLLSEGVKTVTDGAVTASYSATEAGEALTLFAVAIDAEGKIGKPLKQEFTTKAFEYNDLAVTLHLVDYKVDNTLIAVECEGASRFKYVYCSLSDSKWKNLYGGTAKKAGEYIIMNPTSSYVYDTDTTPLVDGSIFLSGLNTETEYVLVCVAVDAEGVVSQPATCYFEPIANIGNMVKRTDANWADGKPTITLGETTEVEFFNIEWFTTPQEGYVAYSMVDHPANLVSDYFGTNVNTPEKLIAYIVAGCDNGKRDCGHRCEYEADGNYSRTWQEMEDINGDGRIDPDEWVTHTKDGYPGVYNFFFYGTKGEHRIYVTWVGEDGNFHEPFVYNPTTDQEEELNIENFPGYF